MAKPRGEGQPNFEGQAGQDVEQLLTFKGSNDLPERIVPHEEGKRGGIVKQLINREATIAEDARLASSLAKAEEILKYFETRNKLGLPISEKDIAELEDAKAVVASLSVQKESMLQEYKTIMSDPAMYERVWEEAHGEDMARDVLKDRELKEKRERAVKEMAKRVEEISNAIEPLFLEKERRDHEVNLKREACHTAERGADRIIWRARDILGPDKNKTREILRELSKRHLVFYEEAIQKFRWRRKELDSSKSTWLVTTLRRMGLSTDKEKVALDYILREADQFSEAIKKHQELSKALEAKEKWERQQMNVLAKQYEALLLEARAKGDAIHKEFATYYTFDGLPEETHNAIRMNLQRIAGLGEIEDGRWIRPMDYYRDPRLIGVGMNKYEEWKKFSKLNALLDKIKFLGENPRHWSMRNETNAGYD